MKHTLCITLLSLLLFTSAQPTLAQDDSAARRAVAERVVAMTTAETVVEAMIGAVWPSVRDNIVAQNPSVSAELLGAMYSVMADTTRELVVDMSSDVTGFYAEEFELAELEALEAFYASDTGAKQLALTPKLMNQIMPGMLAKTQQMMPRMLESIRKAAEQRGLKLDI